MSFVGIAILIVIAISTSTIKKSLKSIVKQDFIERGETFD